MSQIRELGPPTKNSLGTKKAEGMEDENKRKRSRVRVILYKRVFRFHRKTGTEKQDRAEKQRACFSFTRFRNDFEKMGCR